MKSGVTWWPGFYHMKNTSRKLIYLTYLVTIMGITLILHQQNVKPSGSHMQTFQTLQLTSPMLPSTSRCSQPPLELSKVLSDSAREFSGAPESTCIYGGAFRMLWYLTYRIVKFRSSWNLCAALRESWCHILTAVFHRVPQPQGISSIVFVFVTVTWFAKAQYGMYYLSKSLYI